MLTTVIFCRLRQKTSSNRFKSCEGRFEVMTSAEAKVEIPL